jgi:hypothetical protein
VSRISAIFRTRTNSIIYKIYTEMGEGMGQPGQWLLRDGSTRSMTFDYHWKSMESWVGTNQIVFCSSHNAVTYSFSKCNVNKRGLQYTGSVAFSKHVTHYGPRSGFLYYNLTTPPSRGIPLSAIWGCVEQLLIWALGTFTSTPKWKRNLILQIL